MLVLALYAGTFFVNDEEVPQIPEEQPKAAFYEKESRYPNQRGI